MTAVTVHVGWDPRDISAYAVCIESLIRHSSIDLEIRPIYDAPLREANVYYRSYRVDNAGQMWDDGDGRPFSTAFSFARFAVPIVEDYAPGRVVYCDPDFLWRADIAELLAACDGDMAVSCVQHDYAPVEQSKMDGVIQQRYRRKNWSSLMVIDPEKCRPMTRYMLNRSTGAQLHGFTWIMDDLVGALDERWNWLEGWSDPKIEPAIVHYTRGTPDFPGYENSDYADEWHDSFNRALKAGLVTVAARRQQWCHHQPRIQQGAA